MIFVSKYGAYKHIAKHEGFDRLTHTGLGGGYVCEFRPDVINAHMERLRVEEASGRLKFNGTPRWHDTGLPLDPADRCSSFDTDSVPEQLRREVETSLLGNPAFGHDYWLFEIPEADAPYPKYNQHRKTQGRRTLEHAIADITAAYEAVGFDIDQAVEYERQNDNNEQIIAALQALKAAPAEEPEEELVTA